MYLAFDGDYIDSKWFGCLWRADIITNKLYDKKVIIQYFYFANGPKK